MRELYETIAEGLGRKAIPFGVPHGAARFLAVLGDIGGRATGRQIQFNTETLRKLTTPEKALYPYHLKGQLSKTTTIAIFF